MYRFFALCLFASLTVSATIAAPSGLSDQFGRAIATEDGYLFIADNGGFKSPPMVHVYVRENQQWVLTHSLQTPNARKTGFGMTLAYKDETLAISAQAVVYMYEQYAGTGEFILSDQ